MAGDILQEFEELLQFLVVAGEAEDRPHILGRRKLNFFRFFRELFKQRRLRMINVGIMHEYIQKLLATRDEFCLECLCKLLNSSVRQQLDLETKMWLHGSWNPGPLQDLSVYFNEMAEITHDRNLCPRVRSMMQELIRLYQASQS